VLRNENIVPPKIFLPQISPNERPFLEPDQIKQFVSAAEGADIEIPALLALSSLRRSEICALRWENIDLEKQRILVKGAAVYDQHQKLVQKKENKNRTSARYVPIMMKELLVALHREKKPTGSVVQCAPNTIRARINRICEANHLPLVGVHGLRHSFASLAYHLGVPEKIAMEIGGWANSQTMHKIYTHIAKSDVTRYETELTAFFQKE
jgi:integrase